MSNEIDIKVTTRTTVNIKATKELEDGTKVMVRSLSRGIRLSVKKPSQYYADEITIPEAAFDTLGEVFAAVRAAREEHTA